MPINEDAYADARRLRKVYEDERAGFAPGVSYSFYQFLGGPTDAAVTDKLRHRVQITGRTSAGLRTTHEAFVYEQMEHLSPAGDFWTLRCANHSVVHTGCRCTCIDSFMKARMDSGLYGGVEIPGRLFPIYACVFYMGEQALDVPTPPWPNTAQVLFSITPIVEHMTEDRVFMAVTSRLDASRLDLIQLLREKVDAEISKNKKSGFCVSKHHSGSRNLAQQGNAYSHLLWRILGMNNECYDCHRARLDPEYLNQR